MHGKQFLYYQVFLWTVLMAGNDLNLNKFICPLNVNEYKKEDYLTMFRHALGISNVNDFYIRIGHPIIVRESGTNYVLSSKQRLSPLDVKNFVTENYDEGVWSDVRSGEKHEDTLDFPLDPEDIRGRELVRMRVIITRERGTIDPKGVMIVLRPISNYVPTFDDLNVRQIIRDNVLPRQGLVVIAGETGSGKSTLMASIIHCILTDTSRNTVDAVIAEFSDPPEFVFDSVHKGRNMISQSWIGVRKDCISFAQGILNAKRQDTTHILIGESRDQESVGLMLQAADIGNVCYTTYHANNISGVIKGMAEQFEGARVKMKAYEIVRIAKLIVVQYLAKVPSGRIPIQEILVFDDNVKKRVASVPYEKFYSEIDKCVREYGILMSSDAKSLLGEGKIDESTYKIILSGCD
jgi:defect-in-organelle-trafficking protein DotB